VEHTETSILEQLTAGRTTLLEGAERAQALLQAADESVQDEVFFALGVLYIANLESPDLRAFAESCADLGGLRGLTVMAIGMSELLREYDRETDAGRVGDENLGEISYLERHTFSHPLLTALSNEAGRAILVEHNALREEVLKGGVGVARHRLALEQFDDDYSAAIAYASDFDVLVGLSALQSMRCGVRALITLIQLGDEQALERALCAALESSSMEWRALWSDGVRSLGEAARNRVLQARGSLYCEESALEAVLNEASNR
jgi:hypothetical protein